ncbi:MAG: 50S ribosomal protein L15 [Chlamydiales bacterium]
MIKLALLKNTSRKQKRSKLLGRGPGSKRGKTCGRGHKGMGARSGYTKRLGYIGGGVPLHKTVPTRGFSNFRFAKKLHAINLKQINAMYDEGEIVNLETLKAKGFIKGQSNGVKVLADGELLKKVSFQVESFSYGAKKKIKATGILI